MISYIATAIIVFAASYFYLSREFNKQWDGVRIQQETEFTNEILSNLQLSVGKSYSLKNVLSFDGLFRQCIILGVVEQDGCVCVDYVVSTDTKMYRYVENVAKFIRFFKYYSFTEITDDKVEGKNKTEI